MDTPIKILGFAGSLRKASYNRGALRAAQELVPPGATLEIAEIDQLPLYNQDLEADPPRSVTQLRQRVRAADAILFATPEYNYSIPGVLKNAIDWASRPKSENAWHAKPVAIMGAAGSALGTARAQYHLRQTFVFLNMYPLNQPEVMIANAAEKFDQNGTLTDERTRERIRLLLEALVRWTRQLKRALAD